VTLSRLRKWTVVAIAGVAAFFFAACLTMFSHPDVIEDNRVTNPSKTVDAVVETTSSGGAVGSLTTDVYAVAVGKPASAAGSLFARNSLRFDIHYPRTLHLEWRNNRELEVHVICEQLPRATEVADLRVNGERIAVDIVYDACVDRAK
jgi:hypothetical protein